MEQVISKIDPALEYEGSFYSASTTVCKVRRGDGRYLLKMAQAEDPWQVNQMRRERDVLARTFNVAGVTKMLHVYPDSAGYAVPILKEYFEGETLHRLGSKVSKRSAKDKLAETVFRLHRMGIANLDLKPANVVLSGDRQDVRLFDLGSAIWSTEVEPKRFNSMVEEDTNILYYELFN